MFRSRIMLAALVWLIWGVSGFAIGAEAKAVKSPRAHKIRVLLVTGGHGFEHEPFLDVFRSQPDLVVKEVKQPDAQAWFAPDKADQYDVMVWYDMWQDISEQARKDLLELLNHGKPLVAIHHCIASYQEWPEAIKIVGGKFLLDVATGRAISVAKDNGKLNVKLADHPVTRFMKDFTLADDEIYGKCEILPGVKPLMSTDNPENNKLLGWVHTYGKSTVVYLQPGHGLATYKDPNYRRLVGQAIRWAAGQLPEESEDGFVSLFNGKDLTGWHVMGKPEAFKVMDGVIRSESGKEGLWLRSDRQYCDFILQIEWRVGKNGNSGVFLRSRIEGYPWDTGQEVQISNEHRDDLHCTGSLYGRVPVDPRPDESADVWHEYEIQCRGPFYRVFADRVPVVDVDQRDVPAMKDFPLCGYIGMQDSHNDTGWIEFRNIRIKELRAATQPAK